MPETIFSKIIRGEIPANILHDDADVMAFTDISPQAPVHVVVIPKRMDIATLNDLSEEMDGLIGKMVRVARDVAVSLGVSENGYRLVFNCNNDGGQAVYHLHVHLLGGRAMGWPPG